MGIKKIPSKSTKYSHLYPIFVKMSFKRKEPENARNQIENKGSALCRTPGL